MFCSHFIFSLFSFFLLISFINSLPHKKHKLHPHPPHKLPSYPSKPIDNIEEFNYCKYNNFIYGQKCGNKGLFDTSFCVADIENNPVCIASVWCYNIRISCTSNSDCSPGEVCVDPFCGSGFQCNPLCNNVNLPYDPLYDNSPYYWTDSDRCYDHTDIDLSENTPLETEKPLPEGSTYWSYHKGIESYEDEIVVTQYYTSTVLFSSLLIFVVIGTLLIVRSSSLKIRELDQTTPKEIIESIELEPFIRDGKQSVNEPRL